MMCVQLTRFLYGGYRDYMSMPLRELEVLMEAAQKVSEQEAEQQEKQNAEASGKGVKGGKIEAELTRIAQKQAAEQSNG